MGFESVRGYVQLASGLGEQTRARATEAAQGLLSLPAVGMATGKVAAQVAALAEELLAAAATNRENLTTLIRAEVDAAVTRMGLVTAKELAASQAEADRLRAEVAKLRSAASTPSAAKKTSPRKTTARKTTAKKAVAKKAGAKKTAAKTSPATSAASSTVNRTTTARRSAITTRRKPAGT